jgi:hypothetical protein
VVSIAQNKNRNSGVVVLIALNKNRDTGVVVSIHIDEGSVTCAEATLLTLPKKSRVCSVPPAAKLPRRRACNEFPPSCMQSSRCKISAVTNH